MQVTRVLGQGNAREHTYLLKNSSWQAIGHERNSAWPWNRDHASRNAHHVPGPVRPTKASGRPSSNHGNMEMAIQDMAQAEPLDAGKLHEKVAQLSFTHHSYTSTLPSSHPHTKGAHGNLVYRWVIFI